MRLNAILLLIPATLALLGSAGCGAQRSNTTGEPQITPTAPVPPVNAFPTWYQDPTVAGTQIAAVGTCQRAPGQSLNAQREYATGRAQTALVRSLENTVSTLLEDFEGTAVEAFQSETNGYTPQARRTVSRQFAHKVLRNVFPRDLWQDAGSGELAVRVVMDPAIAARMPQEIRATAEKHYADRLAAMRAKGESEKAMAELDRLESNAQKQLALPIPPAGEATDAAPAVGR